MKQKNQASSKPTYLPAGSHHAGGRIHRARHNRCRVCPPPTHHPPPRCSCGASITTPNACLPPVMVLTVCCGAVRSMTTTYVLCSRDAYRTFNNTTAARVTTFSWLHTRLFASMSLPRLTPGVWCLTTTVCHQHFATDNNARHVVLMNIVRCRMMPSTTTTCRTK